MCPPASHSNFDDHCTTAFTGLSFPVIDVQGILKIPCLSIRAHKGMDGRPVGGNGLLQFGDDRVMQAADLHCGDLVRRCQRMDPGQPQHFIRIDIA